MVERRSLERLYIRHIVPPLLSRIPTNLSNLAVSGLTGAAIYTAQEQARQGHRVELWGWSRDSAAQEYTYHGLQVHLIKEWAHAKIGPYDLRWFAPYLVKTWQRSRVDVLHVHTELGMLRLPNTRLKILHLQSALSASAAHWTHLYRQADAIFCASAFLKHQFTQQINYPPDRVFVMYNGVHEIREMAGEPATQLRNTLGVAADHHILLYTGAINPIKGTHILVEAVRSVIAEHPKVTLIVVGGSRLWYQGANQQHGDPFEQQVRVAARDLPVVFTGIVPHERVSLYMDLADIFILPSTQTDIFPLAVAEAMGAGKPVIASRVGGVPEIVQHEQTGLLVPPGRADELAAAILRLLHNPAERQSMGKKSRERARMFSWETLTQQQIATYYQLLEHKRSR